jgi:hypothetical protein
LGGNVDAADDENRASALVEHASGARAVHNQIGIDGVGKGHDLVGRIALEQLGLDLDALLGGDLDCFGSKAPDRARRARAGRWFGDGKASVRHDIDSGRDMDYRCPHVLVGGEGEPELERLVGRVRAIGCDQDRPHRILRLRFPCRHRPC